MLSLEDAAIWKWWLLRDDRTEIHSSCADNLKRFELPRPSVRYLKTVNTADELTGIEMAVSAQQYCVLLTNFPNINLSKDRYRNRINRVAMIVLQ